jgi:hypothetical protein
MYIPNKDVYEILKSVKTGVSVYPNRPEVIENPPCMTYFVENNGIELDLSKEIAYQDIDIVVDIWAETMLEATEILDLLERGMRENNFMLDFSSEVDDENLKHITTRFNFIG